MRTILYALTAFALCSCAGHHFLHQKYTHFSHTKVKPEQKHPAAVQQEKITLHIPEKRISADEKPGNEQLTASVTEKRSSSVPEKSFPPLREQLFRSAAPIPGSSQPVPVIVKEKNISHAHASHKIPHLSRFEEWMLGLALFAFFILLPVAFVAGLVLLFFNLLLGSIVAGTALLVFVTVLLIVTFS